MVWLFALLAMFGFALQLPFWKGVAGGHRAKFVGIPLAVIGLIGALWLLLLSIFGFDSLVGYAETLALLYGWTLLTALAFAIGEAVFRKKPPAPEPSANQPTS